MTTQTEAGAAKSFTTARLPWIVAALAAVVYLFTLNPWVSPASFQALATVTGETWHGNATVPAFNLVISPLRWLPVAWVPMAFNVFSAVCAVIVLGLLARCVALMPQDRTYKQREREQNPFGLLSFRMAWIPPVLAVLVCGLQLTFWENATNLSSNMFDLVLFAYCVRCLLEYRISGRESWLLRAVVVYAVGITDTWVFLALAPAFLVALVWIRGFGFFQLRFLARLFLCGLAGFLFYLYLPLTGLRTGAGFWTTLQSNLNPELQSVVWVYRHAPHPLQFLMVLTSLLPILVIGIRWKSHFGDSSQLGTALTTWIFHLTHAVLLGLCIWAAFDTGFSLRDAQEKFSFLDYNRDQVLPLYFLGALSIGYLSGYFLLVFRPMQQRSYRSGSRFGSFLNGFSATIICALLVLAPLGLLYKNLPQIKIANGPALRQYASALTENLPSHAVLLSDRPDVLILAHAWLARAGTASNYLFLDTGSLKMTAYHRYQKAQHPDIWPILSTNVYRDDVRFTDSAVIDLLLRLAQKDSLYYLNPSFGAYFELFYPVPHGLVYEMKKYPINTEISAPPVLDTVLGENETFWRTHEPSFSKLLPFINPPDPAAKMTFRRSWMQRMHIPFEKNRIAGHLGSTYSLALNTLGVYDQRLGRLEAAETHFKEAQEFSSDNVVAAANLDFNKRLRAGERIVAESPETFEEHFGKFSGWEQLINNNGFFDTATGCLAQGIVFAHGGLRRQGTQQFERVLSLAPDNPLAQLWLARSYVNLQMPEKALPLIENLKTHSGSWADASIVPSDIVRIELATDYVGKKTENIPPILNRLSDTNDLDAALETCARFGDFTNALVAIEKQLKINPDNVSSLMNEGSVQFRLGNFDQAIPPFTRAIMLQPTNIMAHVFRGAAYLQTGKLDEARHDYGTLEKADPKAFYIGMAEIAFHEKDTNKAIHYYELCLSNAVPNSPEAKLVADRIKKLQTGSP